MKPTRAWAVVTKRGRMVWIEFGYRTHKQSGKMATKNCNLKAGERVIEVLITPIDDQADELRGKR